MTPDENAPPDETTAPFHAFARQWLPRIEDRLESLLPAAEEPPARLHEAMRYAMFPGGKRLRPLLAMMGCVATGGDPTRALLPASAIELLHTYSLVHDDLPCMDDDDLRRGRPTCHVRFGEATAVLVGDALLTLAFEAVAAGGADAVVALAQAAGSSGMVGGQAADLEAEGVEGDHALDADRVRWIHDHKTAALIRASLLVGAHAGGGDLSQIETLSRYGDRIGRAFQIADDCLDLTGTAQDLGKQPGQDLAARKLTYPAVMGLSESRAEARALVRDAEQLAMTIGPSTPNQLQSVAGLLVAAARFTVSRGS